MFKIALNLLKALLNNSDVYIFHPSHLQLFYHGSLLFFLFVIPHNSFGNKFPYESTGYKATAIPILNFNSDDGAGYGVRSYLYNYDGNTIPYQRQYSLQAFFTTGGKWVHRVLIDDPNFISKYRVEI